MNKSKHTMLCKHSSDKTKLLAITLKFNSSLNCCECAVPSNDSDGLGSWFLKVCVARCGHDWGARASLTKEFEGQMLIVTNYQAFRPNIGPTSVVVGSATDGRWIYH